MKDKVLPIVETILQKNDSFKNMSFIWWADKINIDSSLSTDNLKTLMIAKHYVYDLRVDAYVHNDHNLLLSLTPEKLRSFKLPRTLRVNVGTWENLNNGWKTITADYKDVYSCSADYLFHGYVNNEHNGFVTFVLVRWEYGLRDVIVSNGPSNLWNWRRDDKDELFWSMGYDDLVKTYPEFVITYDAQYWIDKGIMSFGDRIPMPIP